MIISDSGQADEAGRQDEARQAANAAKACEIVRGPDGALRWLPPASASAAEREARLLREVRQAEIRRGGENGGE